MMAASQAETISPRKLNSGLTREDFNQMMRVNAPVKKTVKRERVTMFHKRTAWEIVREWYFSKPSEQRRAAIFTISLLLLISSIWQMRRVSMKRNDRAKINLKDSVWNATRSSSTKNLQELESYNDQKNKSDHTRDLTK